VDFQFRKPLTVEQVPLPEGGGYSHAILLPEYKQKLAEDHILKRREWMEKRLMVWHRCQTDAEYRAMVYEKCRRSCSYFINLFVETYDDRSSRGSNALILYDFQEQKIVHPYERMCRSGDKERVTLGYAKSRATGYTWVSLAARVWRWMFYNNWSILIGSENRDDVDDGGQAATQQSLFGKIRFIINNLPRWMRDDLLGPLYWKEEFNKRMLLKNPLKPQNVINGKQLGAMFGRSRRYSEILADEVAHSEEMAEADTSLKNTTYRFCFGSTPKGKGNFFYQVMHGGLAVAKFYMWWAEHPELTLEWYNQERQHSTDDTIAQELDISFERSAGDRVLHEVTVKDWFTDKADFDPHLPITVVMDPGFADHFAAIWCQWDPLNRQGRVIDFVQTNRRTVDWIVPFIHGSVPATTYVGMPWPHEYNEIEKTIIERHAVWLREIGGFQGAQIEFLGDDAGNASNIVTGSSAWDELQNYGIYVEGIKIRDDEEAIRKMNLMVRHIKFNSRLIDQRNGPKEQAPTWSEVVTQWKYPKPREGSVARVTRPIHDIYCHGGDCIKMWCSDLELPDSQVSPVAAGMVIKASPSSIIEPSDTEAGGLWR
jgi:hypothetical protein